MLIEKYKILQIRCAIVCFISRALVMIRIDYHSSILNMMMIAIMKMMKMMMMMIRMMMAIMTKHE